MIWSGPLYVLLVVLKWLGDTVAWFASGMAFGAGVFWALYVLFSVAV